MNRNLLMPVAVSLILLSGCKYNDDNFEGLDDMTQPTNLMKIEYTLTDADYATISSNSTNKKSVYVQMYMGEACRYRSPLRIWVPGSGIGTEMCPTGT